jgi:S-DNA-T family DNA segregation ATPase FtsK/SpoIIIE
MAAMAGSSALMVAGGGGRPVTYVGSGMMALSMGGMVVGQVSRSGSEKKQKLNSERRDYLRYLSQLRRRVRAAAAQQREALTWALPDPESLWSIAMSSRLWERRPGDNDFGDIRIGTGTQRLSATLIPPQTKPVEDLDPITALALRRFVSAHSSVPSLPLGISLRAFPHVVLSGAADAAKALARGMLAHAATFHSPDELRILVGASPERRAAWEWVKWLPHTKHPTAADGAGPLRLVTGSLPELEAALADEFADRPRFTPDAAAVAGRPHLLVVLDGVGPERGSRLSTGPLQGVTAIELADQPAFTARTYLHLSLDQKQISALGRDRDGSQVVSPIGRPDQLSSTAAEALARTLARYRTPDSTEGPAVSDGELAFTDLLGLPDLARLDVAQAWRPRPQRDRLRVPIGVDRRGLPVELDVKESAQGGFGPHGLVIGATGSGKSELLRTLVLGLAMTHSSETLNFVLTDFKGGATFLGLERLPHVSAVITNLADELPLVDRMKDALQGELVRRQELLRAAGNYASLRDYEKAREAGAPLAPLPSLLVITDEFSELLSSKPDFAELFVMIGRLGRSLGVHLLLASQRLEEGRLRGLESHLSYRIGLRTFSSAESRLVIGVPDAYELPSAPGNGYLRTDTSTLNRFKAAYVSGPYQQGVSSRATGAAQQRAVVPFGTGAAAIPVAAEPPVPAAAQAGGEGPQPSLLDVAVERLQGQGPAAHRVWLPPLADAPSLDGLYPPLRLRPEGGISPSDWDQVPALRVAVGIVDRPFEQRRELLWADLAGAAGHVVVVGGTQSGKSTVLRTLMTGLALTHSPSDVQFYVLDFGGGAMSTLAALPHLGQVAGRLEPDLVNRTVAEVRGVIEERERLFSERGIDSMTTYRRLRAQGAVPDDGFGDVFLIVDGMLTLRQDFEALEVEITSLAARGLAFGIHVVVAASRWAELRPALRDLIQTRFELRLGDPGESTVDRRAAVNVPQGRPGRGITEQKLQFLAALPRIDGSSSTDDLADGIRGLADTVAAAWPGVRAPGVRTLPERFDAALLPAPSREAGVPFAVSETTLRPLALDFAQDPHLLVFGETESGKTNLLRLIADGVAAAHAPEEARFIVADYRRTLLGLLSPEHMLGYATSSPALQPLLNDAAEALKERLPGPNATMEELRNRSWQGPELYVIVDDYDLVVTGPANPLAPLVPLLAQARDIGLHLVVARRSGGAGRAVFEAGLQRLREIGTPALMMSTTKDEGAFLGVKPRLLPAGRGYFISRRTGVELIQTALVSDPVAT